MYHQTYLSRVARRFMERHCGQFAQYLPGKLDADGPLSLYRFSLRPDVVGRILSGISDILDRRFYE
jgi:hypothetical protein